MMYKSRIMIEIARGLKAFLNLEVCTTRGTVPNLARLREESPKKDSQLKRMQKRLFKKERQVARLQARQRSIDSHIGSAEYNHDGLVVWGKDVSFLREPSFVKAYEAGMNSGHKLAREKGSDKDIHIEWRVHVACWAAWHAKQLPGSFVECGVNTGIFSLAVCNYIDFNSTDKDFFLFDTFEGIPKEQMAEQETDRTRLNQIAYEECYEVARRNFEPFPRARLVHGTVPGTLDSVDIGEVCYLSIDMNIAEPEIANVEFFWDKLAHGAPVLLDDYAWHNHTLQKEEMDNVAFRKGVKILTMPTGQGLLFKP